MRRIVVCASVLLVFVALAFADDQQKAEKQIRMMTAMSWDDTARSIVSRTFADVFKMQRPQMVVERKNLGLNYGGLFLAHELILSGTRIEEIAQQLRARKSILDITNESHADWKRIASDAKRMNNRITDSVYKHFLHSKPDEERDKLEHYNPSVDLVRADAEATPNEILSAEKEYVFWRNQAAPNLAGQADPWNPVAHTYTTQRDSMTASHGTVYPGAPQK